MNASSADEANHHYNPSAAELWHGFTKYWVHKVLGLQVFGPQIMGPQAFGAASVGTLAEEAGARLLAARTKSGGMMERSGVAQKN
jgi:hypothetical protein